MKNINDLKEKYLRTSTELGRAAETEAAFYLEKKFGIALGRYHKVSRSEFARQDPELFILSRSGLTEQARIYPYPNMCRSLKYRCRSNLPFAKPRFFLLSMILTEGNSFLT